MNLVKPYARVIGIETKDQGIQLLRKIEWCGRISHRSEDVQSVDSWERFIKAVVMGHGDWSIVEHSVVSVDMLVDRGITHEIVRHRLFSFTQESTRFVNYEKKMPASFILPDGIDEDSRIYQAWTISIARAESTYKEMLAAGCTPQIARSVFPNALASRIVVTGNLRNWRHIFLMRTTREAHPQMREVMIPLLTEFKGKIPLLFDDIEPGARQIDNLRLPR